MIEAVLWTLGSVAGMGVVGANLWRAWVDWRLWLAHGDGGIVGLVAKGNMRNEVMRFLVMLVMAMIGVLSLAEIRTPLIRWSLVAIPFLLAFNSLGDLRDRQAIMRNST